MSVLLFTNSMVLMAIVMSGLAAYCLYTKSGIAAATSAVIGAFCMVLLYV